MGYHYSVAFINQTQFHFLCLQLVTENGQNSSPDK
jgi:hypothetical protein